MRRFVSSMVMATMVTGLLAGCSTSSSTTTTAVATTAAAATTVAAEKSEESTNTAKEMVEFDVWHSMEGTNGEAFEVMIKEFNETKGSELGIVANSVFQGNDTASKLKTLIQTNDIANMPDVCLVYGASLPVVAEYEHTVPVDDMYGQGSASLSKDEVNPGTAQTYTYKGKQINMPFNSSTLLLYYNVDAFTEAGLDPENPPTTLDEVAEAAKVLTIMNGDTVERYGFNAVLDRYVMVNLIGNQGEGGTYFGDNESGRNGLITKLTCEEELAKIFTAWENLAATGGFKYTYDNQNEEFATGKNAMTLMSSARIGSITNLTKDSGVNWAVSYLPDASEGDNGGACIGGASFAMFDNGDDAKKMAAWEFIQYTASAETQAFWSQSTGYLPINLNTESLPEYSAYVKESPATEFALKQFAASQPNVQEPVMMMQGSIDGVIKDASVSICEGTMTAEEATAYTIEECNILFEEYNRANQ